MQLLRTMIRMTMAAAMLAGLVAATGCGSEGTDAGYAAEFELENANTIKVMTGTYRGTLNRLAGEMGDVLLADDLRMVPMTGRGSLQTIRDLLYLEGVDVGMFASFVVEYGRRNNLHAGVDLDRIEYVGPLFTQHMHILARNDIQTLEQLEGRRVNIGPANDLTNLMATLVFNDRGLQVDILTESHGTAVQQVQDGTIDAMVRIGGLPQSLFDGIDETSGLHFIPISSADLNSSAFGLSSMPADAYPGLIPAGTQIPTATSSTMIAVYNPTGVHPNAELVDRFVTRLFEGISTLQDPEEGYHAAWADVNLNGEVAGIPRYSTAANLAGAP